MVLNSKKNLAKNHHFLVANSRLHDWYSRSVILERDSTTFEQYDQFSSNFYTQPIYYTQKVKELKASQLRTVKWTDEQSNSSVHHALSFIQTWPTFENWHGSLSQCKQAGSQIHLRSLSIETEKAGINWSRHTKMNSWRWILASRY